MKKIYKYNFTVRGYELDSFGHVNNAVYLNYLEQARWGIMNEFNLLDYFKKTKNFLIVIETNIKYINELNIFDNVFIDTSMEKSGFYLIFSQMIRNKDTNQKIAKAEVKCIFVDKARTPLDVPKILTDSL